MKDQPRPPSHLAAPTKRWFRSVVQEYLLEPHGIRILQLAGEAWDRGVQAREALARDGLTFRDDRGNIRPHPLISVEKDSRTAFTRLLRELDLDGEPVGLDRPPPLRRNSGGR